MKKIIGFLIFSCLFANSYAVPALNNNDYRLIMSSQNMQNEKEELLDINKASEQDMLGRKISKSYVSKIMEYREITGGFDKLEDLKRIKGIGDATYQKLSKFLKVGSAPTKSLSKNARFFVADTTDVVQKALDIHKYDEYSMKTFGKFCTLAAIMGATLKGEDKLTIRTDTDGYIKNIVVNSDANGDIKGYLINTSEENFESLGKGTMRIIKDMGLKEPYVAITNVDYSSLPDDISAYFYNSEQIPTIISLACEATNDGKILCAGAFMVQLLPGADEDFITKLERKAEAIRPMNELMKGGMSLEQIINLLYDDMDTADDSLVEEYEILEEKELKYNCDCNSDRFQRGIMTLGKEELKHIFEEEKEIEAECQFCGKKYKFTENDFEDILKK